MSDRSPPPSMAGRRISTRPVRTPEGSGRHNPSFLQYTFLRLFIIAQPQKHRSAQLRPAPLASPARPLCKLDFRYQLRFHKTHLPQRVNIAEKRILLRLQFLQYFRNFTQRFLIEPTYRLPHMNPPPLLVIRSEHKRTKMGAAAPGFRVSTNDGLQPMPNLDLQPFAAAAL